MAARVDLLLLDVNEVLGGIADRVRLATLSNNGLLVRELFDRIYPAVAELGAEAHVAAEYGESKPDRDVYLDACAALGTDPARTAFVDDKEANAAGAAGAGLRAHHFTGVVGLRVFLAELGLGRESGSPG